MCMYGNFFRSLKQRHKEQCGYDQILPLHARKSLGSNPYEMIYGNFLFHDEGNVWTHWQTFRAYGQNKKNACCHIWNLHFKYLNNQTLLRYLHMSLTLIYFLLVECFATNLSALEYRKHLRRIQIRAAVSKYCSLENTECSSVWFCLFQKHPNHT